MQFLFYLIAAIILLFFFTSTIIGLIGGGQSFFDSFKKGFKFLLVASIILVIAYFIYSFFANIKYNPNGPIDAYKELKRNGFDLLTARPYYFILIGYGVTVLIGVLFERIIFKRMNWENLNGSLGLFFISYFIFSFSEDGLYFKNFSKYLIVIFFVVAVLGDFLQLYVYHFNIDKIKLFGKERLNQSHIESINKMEYPKLYVYGVAFISLMITLILVFFMFFY